jgi:hypothetical protein
MPALVAGIHVLGAEQKQDVDGRDQPGHDKRQELSSIHHALVSRVLVKDHGGALRRTRHFGSVRK